MKNPILTSLLLGLFLMTIGLLACNTKVNPVEEVTRFSLKGSQAKEVMLYGQNYTFQVTNIDDLRCTMNPTAFGLYGIRVYLDVKSKAGVQHLELFSSRCDKRSMGDTLTFFDNESTTTYQGTTVNTSGFSLGLFDATPLQQVSSQSNQYPLSSYEIVLITKNN